MPPAFAAALCLWFQPAAISRGAARSTMLKPPVDRDFRLRANSEALFMREREQSASWRGALRRLD